MDLIELLAPAVGIGFLSGFRLYLTVLVLGTAIRFDLLQAAGKLSGLAVLADWKVMAGAGLLCAVEFVADKVPWFDSMWDAVHTFIRPVAAAVLAAAAMREMDPALKTIVALLAGGVALSSHSAKAATRLAANHSPEPFSNWALSLGEDVAAPVGLWLLLAHPFVLLGIVIVFLVVFVLLVRRVWRWMQLSRDRQGAGSHSIGSSRTFSNSSAYNAPAGDSSCLKKA